MVATETKELTSEQSLEIMFYHNDGKKLSFSSDTLQSIKRQNKGPKEHNENIYPVVDRNRPIRKTQAQDRYS